MKLTPPQSAARRLYQRSRGARQAREETNFRTRLRVEDQAPALVLSPHWDDAVLDCWSVLSSEGEVSVLNVFGGVPGPRALTLWDSITGAEDSSERARERICLLYTSPSPRD